MVIRRCCFSDHSYISISINICWLPITLVNKDYQYSLALRRGCRPGRCRYGRPSDTQHGIECLCGHRRRSCWWWSQNKPPSWPPWWSAVSASRLSPGGMSSWCCLPPGTASALSTASPPGRHVGHVTTTWRETTARGEPETHRRPIRVQRGYTLKHAKWRRCFYIRRHIGFIRSIRYLIVMTMYLRPASLQYGMHILAANHRLCPRMDTFLLSLL